MGEKVVTLGIGPCVLSLRLAMGRMPWIRIVAGLVGVAGLLAWCWLIPSLRSDLESRRRAFDDARLSLTLAQTAPRSHRTPVPQSPLLYFRALLAEDRFREQQVATLMTIAQKNSLALNAADYRFGYDRDGDFYTYQISMPVKGPYEGIRRFCEQSLLLMPFASLDEIAVRRENIASTLVEAKLRFTIFLMHTPGSSEADS